MAEPTEEVTDTFSIVADPVRRCVLYYLADHVAPATYYRLATPVTAWHTDCSPMRSWNESSVSSGGVPGG